MKSSNAHTTETSPIMPPEIFKSLEDEAARFGRQQELASQIMDKDPKLSYISALIIAGDMMGLEHANEMIENGVPFTKALWRVGSYSRLEFTIDQLDKGNATLDKVIPILPQLWSGSDPDDTNQRFFDLWLLAYEANDYKTIYDEGKKLPWKKILTIYRGQDEGAPAGIAWSLSEEIAQKFANGAATRQYNRAGIIYKAKIARKNVIAYLTGRGEQEVIVNPLHFIDSAASSSILPSSAARLGVPSIL